MREQLIKDLKVMTNQEWESKHGRVRFFKNTKYRLLYLDYCRKHGYDPHSQSSVYYFTDFAKTEEFKEFEKLNNHWETTRLNIMTIGKEYEKLIKLAGYKLTRIDYELMSKQTFRINGQFRWWENRPNFGMVRINANLTDEDDVRETIAHELAHAVIDSNNIGHNDTWLKICRDVYRIVGIDPRKARITNDRSLNILAKVKFKMTERGAEIQKSSHYQDTSIIHTKECYTTRQLNNYKKLNSSKVIDIIEIIKD